MDKVVTILKGWDRTPAWLCRQAGISPTLFSLMVKGEKKVSERTKEKISSVLGISEEILFNNKKEISK